MAPMTVIFQFYIIFFSNVEEKSLKTIVPVFSVASLSVIQKTVHVHGIILTQSEGQGDVQLRKEAGHKGLHGERKVMMELTRDKIIKRQGSPIVTHTSGLTRDIMI